MQRRSILLAVLLVVVTSNLTACSADQVIREYLEDVEEFKQVRDVYYLVHYVDLCLELEDDHYIWRRDPGWWEALDALYLSYFEEVSGFVTHVEREEFKNLLDESKLPEDVKEFDARFRVDSWVLAFSMVNLRTATSPEGPDDGTRADYIGKATIDMEDFVQRRNETEKMLEELQERYGR